MAVTCRTRPKSGMARPELHENNSTARMRFEMSHIPCGKTVLPDLRNTLFSDEYKIDQILSTTLALLGAHCSDDSSKPEPEQSQR
jgi:hypothetical protein